MSKLPLWDPWSTPCKSLVGPWHALVSLYIYNLCCLLALDWHKAGSQETNYTVIWHFWRRKWQPTPVLLPGKFHGRRSLVGYSPWGHKESDMTKQLTHTYTQAFISFKGTWKHYINLNNNLYLSEVHQIFINLSFTK